MKEEWNDGKVNVAEEMLFVREKLKDEEFSLLLRREPLKAVGVLEECIKKLTLARMKILAGLGHFGNITDKEIENGINKE